MRNDRIAERRTSSWFSRRTTSTRSSTSSCTVVTAKLRISWAHDKSLNEMEELWKFQGSTLDTIARRRFFFTAEKMRSVTHSHESNKGNFGHPRHTWRKSFATSWFLGLRQRGGRGWRRQTREQRCTPGLRPSASSKLVLFSSSRLAALNGFSRVPKCGGTSASPPTTCRRPPRPRPQGTHASGDQPSMMPPMFTVPGLLVPLPRMEDTKSGVNRQLRSSIQGQSVDEDFGHHDSRGPGPCLWPWRSQPLCFQPPGKPSRALQPQIHGFPTTLLLSMLHDGGHKDPVDGHIGRNNLRGSGRRRRRRRSTPKRDGSILVKKLIGATDSATPAKRPLGERINAFSWSVHVGITV